MGSRTIGLTLAVCFAAFLPTAVSAQTLTTQSSVAHWEGDVDSTISVSASLSAPTNQNVSINYSVVDPGNTTAEYGQYFTPVSGTLTIPAGQTTATMEIPYVGDTVVQGIRVFYIAWSDPVGATLNTQGMPILGYALTFEPVFSISLEYGSMVILNDDDGKPTADNPVTAVIPDQIVDPAPFADPFAPYGVWSIENGLTSADPVNGVWSRCEIIPYGPNPAVAGVDYLDASGDGTDGGTLNAYIPAGETSNPDNLAVRRGPNPTPGRQFVIQVYRGIYAYAPAHAAIITIGE